MLSKKRGLWTGTFLLLMLVTAACSSPEPQGPSAGSDITRGAHGADSDLPESRDDPRCRIRFGDSFASPPRSGDRYVALNPAPERFDQIKPLSTATPKPGTVQFNTYIDTSGAQSACIGPGERTSLSFGATHWFGSDVTLHVKTLVPPGLVATRETETVSDGMWSESFPMPHVEVRASNTSITRFDIVAEKPGRYDVTLLSEWLDTATMQPIGAPNQAEVRTLIYFVLDD